MSQIEKSIRQFQNTQFLNEKALDILARAINLFRGNFALIIVNCNYRCLRQKILYSLTSKTGLLYREIWWRESHESLYEKLQHLWQEDSEGGLEHIPALMCLGLEQASSKNLANLFVDANLLRDRLKQKLNCPLVLWLNDESLQQFLITAPELANLAAPPIRFGLSQLELTREVSQQLDRLFAIATDTQIPLFWQDTKIDADRESFSYRELELARRELGLAKRIAPNGQESPSEELNAKLDFVLGRLMWRSPEAAFNEVYEESNGEVHSVSQIYYQCSLAYWRKTNRLIECGVILFYKGNLWWHKSFENARQAPACWHKARQFFQESISAFQEANRQDLIAKYSRAYSGVLEMLREWDELKLWIKSLLPLHQQMPLELAQDYGYLAKIAVENREWLLVQEYCRNALAQLDIIPQFEDDNLAHNWLRLSQIQYAQCQLLITQSYVQLQDLTTASKLIESAINTFNLNYSPKLYIRLLDTFHEIAFAQGRYLQAFKTRQQQRSLEQQYGLRAFIGAGSLQPKQFSPNANITELDTSRFDANTSEIAASGRSQDVEQLIERILTGEHQLTVIHGESGVGKSSLVNAGLIPALLQRSLTGLELIPIKIHIYTDWIKAIAFELHTYATNNADNPYHMLTAPLMPLSNIGINSSHNGYSFKNGSSSHEHQDNHGNSNGYASNGASEAFKNDQRNNEVGILLHKFRQLASLGVHIVLVFDQFEEFFFTFTQTQERKIFIDFWQTCLKIPSLKVVVSIREDYLHLLLDLEAHQSEIDILSRNFRYAIGNLSPTDAKALIENLTEHANFSLEESLINELVRDLAGDRGSVRPIELQLVGSQLQDCNITTLADYNLAGRKQRLVERSVEEVIQACGNAAFVAQQVLLLLTDEQGKRPLRTYNELRTGILPYSSKTEELDLVLEILIGSGLVFQLPEVPSKRYQLVHDYLVPFIRANQEAGLLAELSKVRSSAQRSQASLNRLTKIALVGTVVALFVMAGLAFQANRQRHLAESGEIEALISSAQSSFLLNRHLEALTTAIQSAKKLNAINAGADKTRITKLTFEALQNIIYNMRERYRFNPEKLDSPFYVAEFSPDGNTLAFGSYDGGVYLFQRDGKPISRLVGYKVKYVRSLSFSPDGKRLASVGKGRSIRIWDIQSGKLIGKFHAHQADISKVSFHPQGKLLLTGSFDGTVKLWDSDRGIEIKTLIPKSPNLKSTNAVSLQSAKVNKQEAAPIQDVSFSPDGKWIVIAKDTLISIWDLEGNLVADTIAHDNKIYSVSFHPQGKMLASSGGDDTVKLWKIVAQPLENSIGTSSSEDIDDESRIEPPKQKWRIELIKPYKGNPTDVLSLNFSSDGRHIAFGSQDNSIQVLNLDGTVEMKLGGHTAGIFDVSFSPDGRYLISASKDRTARLWDLKATLLDTIYGHTDTVWSVSFRPDGKVFASGSVDKTVRIWNNDGSLKQELLGHEGIVYGVSYSPDGKKLVSSSTDKTVRVWDAETGKLLNLLNIHGAELIYATFSPDQRILATLGNDNKIKLWLWDGTNNPRLLQVLEGHTKEVWGISFSPDSKFIASTSNDQTVKVWNVDNGQNVMTMESAHVNGGLAIAYSRDGKLIGSAGKDGKLKLWNAETGILEREILNEDKSWIYGLSFSPDGKAIATATADKKIKIIDLATGETVKTLTGHTAEVNSVTYSPNGKILISASRDNTLKVWNAETLTFDELVQRGCNLLENYLLYAPQVKPEQRQICKL